MERVQRLRDSQPCSLQVEHPKRNWVVAIILPLRSAEPVSNNGEDIVCSELMTSAGVLAHRVYTETV